MIVAQPFKNSYRETSELYFLSNNLFIRIPTKPCSGKMNPGRIISSSSFTIYFNIIIPLRGLHPYLPNDPFRAGASIISLESISVFKKSYYYLSICFKDMMS
jgi:hypothetical protein